MYPFVVYILFYSEVAWHAKGASLKGNILTMVRESQSCNRSSEKSLADDVIFGLVLFGSRYMCSFHRPTQGA